MENKRPQSGQSLYRPLWCEKGIQAVKYCDLGSCKNKFIELKGESCYRFSVNIFS
jgi:hypothetical protein